MQPALTVTILWLVFGGSHIVLATEPVRGRVVRALGEMGFTIVFYLAASLSFAVLVHDFALHRFDGMPGPGLGSVPLLRWVLTTMIVAGVTLLGAALVEYPRLPTALFNQTIRGPRGLERITRHPFFAGVAVVALAHTLLATRLVGTVFFSALTAFCIIGARHQDAKLLARRGAPYRDYLAATSAVPFMAILSGRQRLVWRELPIGALAGGLAAALGLRWSHDAIFAGGGVWIIISVLGGGLVAGFNAWRRARRTASRNVRLEHGGRLLT